MSETVKFNLVIKCGCAIHEFEEKSLSIKFCHLHGAAPDLLLACVAAETLLLSDGWEGKTVHQLADAINKAKGEST